MSQTPRGIATVRRGRRVSRTAGLLTVALALVLGGCTLLRVARHQKPGPQTFRLFPQAEMRPSTRPFAFARPPRPRPDLDSLRVRDGRGRWLSLASYQRAGRVRALLIIRRDTIVYERYAPGFTDTTRASVFSVAKSVLGLLVGIAQAEGRLRPEQTLAELVPELRGYPALAPLTVEQLLGMQSGLRFTRRGRGKLADLFSDEARYFYTHHLKRELRRTRRQEAPGQTWAYKNLDPLLLTWALESATGQPIAAYCEQKLWARIGTRHPASWSLDRRGGLANTASSFQTTAPDLAKLGRLLLQGGRWDDQPVVPEAWVPGHGAYLAADTSVNGRWQQPAHRHYWWLPQYAKRGDFYAEGLGGQLLYVDPRSQTIIVQMAEGGAGDFPYRTIACYLNHEPIHYPE